MHTGFGTKSSRLLSQDDTKQRKTQTSGDIGPRSSFYRRNRLAGSRRWSYSGYGRGPCYRRCEYVLIRVRLHFTSCTDTVRRCVAALFSVLILCTFSRKRLSYINRAAETDTDTDRRCVFLMFRLILFNTVFFIRLFDMYCTYIDTDSRCDVTLML